MKYIFEDLQEPYLFYLYNFPICLEELEFMTEKNGIFTLNCEIICILVNGKYNNVADHHGFVLIRVNFLSLRYTVLTFKQNILPT